ncbi:hypothetical protein AGABI1DRAFT_82443, partial [Agaricus bisporus var. burnettii JB137-S8]
GKTVGPVELLRRITSCKDFLHLDVHSRRMTSYQLLLVQSRATRSLAATPVIRRRGPNVAV